MDKSNVLSWGATPAQEHSGFPINLTPRQREVLQLLCEGLCNKHICRRLGLAVPTVKSHVAGVFRGLNVSTRLEAVAVAYEHGLVAAEAHNLMRIQSVRAASVTIA